MVDDDDMPTHHANTRVSNSKIGCLPANIQRHVSDISEEAVWTLSSCKEGLGVYQLLEERSDTYWQSDGLQPHTITIEFQRKTNISFIVINLDYKADESYTPNKIQVQTGSSILELDDPKTISFTEPTGWQQIDLREDGKAIRAFVIMVQILQNHQNGRDTHVRGLRVLGPKSSELKVDRTFTGNDVLLKHFNDPFFIRSVFGPSMIR